MVFAFPWAGGMLGAATDLSPEGEDRRGNDHRVGAEQEEGVGKEWEWVWYLVIVGDEFSF